MTAERTKTSLSDIANEKDAWNFHYPTAYSYDAGYGLTEETVRYISSVKNEPQWLLDFRLKALKVFQQKTLPDWIVPSVNEIDFSKIRYYLAQGSAVKRTWDEVPEEVKKTFDRLGVPQQERAFLAGVEAQFDSEMAYSNLQKELAADGVIFVNSTEGLLKYESIFRPYFASVIPVGDNRFTALNSAVFSGGSFIYVPKGVKVKKPLQAYFRINAEQFGQFERTLIIVDEGAEVTYLEGCTAPKFETSTLHSAVVELIAKRGAKIQYITVQNWSNNVFNLVTKRARAEENAEIRWIDCNIGSRVTMKYPAVVLAGEGAHGEVLSISVASKGQYQDTGARMIHLAPHTTSHVIAKSISLYDGVASYRGWTKIPKSLAGCKNFTRCDALLLAPESVSKTYPTLSATGNLSQIAHEASISKISQEQLFYMQQRGIPESHAMSLAVNGFINDLVREFPMEYSVELRRLIDLELESHSPQNCITC